MRKSLKVLLIILAASLLVGLVAAYLSPANIIFSNDLALSLSVGKLFLEGNPVWLGPPSHLGGRHLGPLYYWYAALVYFLGRGDLQAITAIGAVFKLAALAVLVYLAALLTEKEKRWFVVLSLLVSIAASHYLWILRKEWHAHFLLIPATLTFFTAFLCLRDGYRFFLPFLLCASLLLQTHYGSLAVIAGLGLAILANFIWRLRHGEKFKWGLIKQKNQILCLALMLLSWVPLLIYELNYRSNILRLFKEQLLRTRPQMGLLESAVTTYRFFRKFTLGSVRFSELIYPFPGAHVLALLVAALGMFFLVLYLIRHRGWQRWYLGALGLSTFLLFTNLARVPPPKYLYYWNQLLPVPALLLGAMLGEAYSALTGVTAASLKWKPLFARTLRLAAGVFLALFLYASLRGVYFNWNGYAFKRFVKEYHSLKHVREVAALIRQDLKPGETARLIGYGSAGVIRDAYYYFLYDEPYPMMRYWQFFKEIPAFKRSHSKSSEASVQNADSSTQRAYLIMCPKVERLERLLVLKELSSEWSLDGHLPLEGCSTCQNCLILRLKSQRGK